MLKTEIQAILKSRGLPISGLKDVLEERLNVSNLQLGWAELAALEFDVFSDIITPIKEPHSAWFADMVKGGPVNPKGRTYSCLQRFDRGYQPSQH